MGLDTVELVMAIEEEFELSISDGDAEKILTPQDMGNLIETILRESGRPMPRESLDQKLKEITLDQIGISESEYRVDAEYVRDFRMD